MDSNRIKGKIKQVEGKLLDMKGDLTNDPKYDIKGKILQAEGTVQEKVGEAKDSVRTALKKNA